MAAGVTVLVIEDDLEVVASLRESDIQVIAGNGVLDAAARHRQSRRGALAARRDSPKPSRASAIVRYARRANPDLTIIARAHFDEEVESLTSDGATT